MDRLAQRLNAQEIIRANVAAETAELETLRDQVEAYDASLRKMQLMSDTSAENVVKIEAILDAYSSQLEGYGDKLTQYESKLHEYQEVVAHGAEASGATKEELEESLATLRSELSEMQEHIEEFSHKENVKVYRNVQAAVGEELNKKVEEITALLDAQSETTSTQLREQSEATSTQLMEQSQGLQRRQDELSRQLAGIQELMNQVLDSTANKGGRAVLVLQIISLITLLANLVVLLIAAGII